jgi:ParB-like chromosome segregation protein Spo0J
MAAQGSKKKEKTKVRKISKGGKKSVKPKWTTDVGDVRGALSLKKVQVKALATAEKQPISNVEWVPFENLQANDYNPNFVYTSELTLLKISLLEDGWTAPIIARRNGDLVDGYHRWWLMTDPQVNAMTDGKVPVVYLTETDPAHQIMSTIRHNRARGAHIVLSMAEVVHRLIDDEGMSQEEVMARLQMEFEEVDRLYDRGDMLKRGSEPELGKGWVPIREESPQK